MSKIRNRFFSFILAIVSVVALLPVVPANAASNINGGWALMNGRSNGSTASYTVYDSSALTNSKGSVSPYEGITVMYQVGNAYYIEYSSANGTNGMKDGYVRISDVNTGALGITFVATVNTASNIYYGPDSSSYDKVGSVSSGEHVCVLAANSPWAYVEYNTSQGRKRGYMSWGNLTPHNQPSWIPDLYTRNTDFHIPFSPNSRTPVYAGPTEKYPIVGYVGTSDGSLKVYYEQAYKGTIDANYIQYKNDNTGKLKSGFVFVDVN